MRAKFYTRTIQTALISVLSLVSALSFAQETIEDRVNRLEQMAETRGQLQADMMFQLNQIQQEIQRLSGLIEEQAFELEQLKSRQRDLYNDIERRLAQLQQSGGSANSTSSSSTVSSTTASSVTPSATAAKADVHSAYQAIFDKVRNKQYDAAITDYQGFLTQYPSSQYEANVHYWMGQIYFIQGKLDDALNSYNQVVNNHPDSSRAADALFKTGKIFLQQQQVDQAKTIFTKVVEQYDGTVEQLAQAELDKLG